MKTHEPIAFAVADPRTFDGDPYEVAERACAQAAGLARILATCIQTANIMARNAQLEREENPDAQAWEDSPQHRKLAQAHIQAKEIERTLNVSAKAAGFDPRKAR
jgi:hypothetical protein